MNLKKNGNWLRLGFANPVHIGFVLMLGPWTLHLKAADPRYQHQCRLIRIIRWLRWMPLYWLVGKYQMFRWYIQGCPPIDFGGPPENHVALTKDFYRRHWVALAQGKMKHYWTCEELKHHWETR